MNKKQRFIWEIYFLILALFIARKAFNFFNPHSDIFLYFHALQSFDTLFLITYFFSFFQIFLSLLLFLPLLLFIYRIKLFPAFVWQVFAALKIIFDIIGHSYELNFLYALFHHDPKICLGTLLYAIAIYIPAYSGVFLYAFEQKKLDLKDF